MEPQADPRAWVELGLAICDETDAIAMRHFRRDPRVSTKPDRTLVTEADEAVEQVVRRRIREAHPDHGLVGEEHGTDAGDARVRWHIDPIDGTHNFVRGVPVFATLLGVELDGELVAGVVSAPAMGDRWYAWRGGGAWAIHRNETPEPRRIGVSAVTTIADAQVVYGTASAITASGRMPGFEALLQESWRDRGFGDFWGFVLVAEGAAEIMVDEGLASWDAAAPAVVVAEAGGRWSDADGEQRLDSGTFVASNGVLHDELLRRLRG